MYGFMWKIEVPWTACTSWATQKGRQGQKKLSHRSKGKKSLLGAPVHREGENTKQNKKTKNKKTGGPPTTPTHSALLSGWSVILHSVQQQQQNPDIGNYLEYEDKILISEVWSTLPLKMAATMFTEMFHSTCTQNSLSLLLDPRWDVSFYMYPK